MQPHRPPRPAGEQQSLWARVPATGGPPLGQQHHLVRNWLDAVDRFALGRPAGRVLAMAGVLGLAAYVAGAATFFQPASLWTLLLLVMALAVPQAAVAEAALIVAFAPLFVVVANASVVAVNQRFEAYLAQLDRTLFGGVEAARWFHAHDPHGVLAMVFGVGYVAYYFLIPAAWLVAALRGPQARRVAHTLLVITFAACCALNLAMPTLGPLEVRHALGLNDPISQFINELYRFEPVGGGAFPSSHVAVGTVCTAILWRCWRPAGIVAAVLLALLTVATVQGGFHYVLDVPAGFAVAFVAIRTIGLPRSTGTRTT